MYLLELQLERPHFHSLLSFFSYEATSNEHILDTVHVQDVTMLDDPK